MHKTLGSRIIAAALGGLMLVSCTASTWATPAPGQYAAGPAAALMSTAQHAANQETRVAAEATADAASRAAATAASDATAAAAVVGTREAAATYVAATATTSYQTTADHLSFRATEVAVNATATAVVAAADAERLAIIDHQTYLANQRQRERMWTVAIPIMVGVATFAVLFLAGAFGVRQIRMSEPVRDGNGNVVLSPAGAYEWVGSRPAAAALPSPLDRPALPPPLPETAVQLPAIGEGHVMVIGPTRSGKSTAFRAMLKGRHNVTVLDPHFAPGDWPGARVIGGGGDFPAIEDFMRWMEQELQKRRQLRAQGQRQFPPTTVATDEMPVIAGELGGDVWAVWRRWLREGWKFGLFFMLSTQSDRVETLGIKGEKDVLDNCAAILYLGAAAVKSFPDVAQPMRRPAVLVQRGGTPQPVVIPYVPEEDPDSPVFDAPQLPAVTSTRPDAAEVQHPPEVVGLHTEQGYIAPAQILQVRRMMQAGESGRAIEREVFGYEGGTAYYMRKTVEALLAENMPDPALR